MHICHTYHTIPYIPYIHTYIIIDFFFIAACIGISMDQIDYCCKDHYRIKGEREL